MKYKEYIENLDNLNDKIEEGLLLDLQEKPPANLHGDIMKSIYREKRRVNLFNYRIYAPAVAAVILLTVVINKPEFLDKINFIKNARITQQQKIASSENTTQGNNQENKGNTTETAASSGTETIIAKGQQTEGTVPKSNTPAAKDNKPVQSNTSSKDVKTASGEKASKSNASTVQEETAVQKNASEENQLNISNYLGMVFFKEPQINYEIVLDTNKAEILNFLTENNEEKLSTPNTYKLSAEQFDDLDKLLNKYDIAKKLVNEIDSSTSRIVKIDFVNYRIVVSNSAPEIVKFIEDQGKSIKVDDFSYKIAIGDMSELNKLLSSAGIKKELVTGVEDKYAVVNALIINYEVSLSASNTDTSTFLKDSAKLVRANTYSMSRESFSKFKDLMNSSNIDIKVLNETNSQDILISVNNI